MRKIIAGMFITLDGVVEAPETWNPPYYEDELNQAVMPRSRAPAPTCTGGGPTSCSAAYSPARQPRRTRR
jgi:hypothetical protein